MTADIREFFDVKAFGDDVRRYKDKQGITSLDLANLAGVNPTVFRELIRDNSWHAMSLLTFLKICRAADLSIEKYVV